MWKRSTINSWLNHTLSSEHKGKPIITFGVTRRSDRLINYFLAGYFLLGLFLASFHGTWLLAIVLGGSSLIIYYLAKLAWGKQGCRYQYVLSVVLGLFVAQFIFQLHGMFEMHFFAFIGSALLITYQNWKLQLPLLVFIILHHLLFAYLQDVGNTQVYFSEVSFHNLPAFAAHLLLTGVICFISGLCAFQLHKYHRIQELQTEQLTRLQDAAQRTFIIEKNAEALEARNIILESISDAFFAVDRHWVVTYWNQTAEKILFKTKQEMLHRNLWDVFNNATETESYRQYHRAVRLNEAVHFEDYFTPLERWFEVTAYPSAAGLSVYFKDITERKQHLAILRESEQRYSDVFHFSPLPMWVVDLTTLKFIDVNRATIAHYGYSREEFLTMTLKDIRPPGELSVMESALSRTRSETAGVVRRVMIHRKKSGELMNVEIQIAPFQFNGVKTSIVIATDITERLLYIEAVEKQNEKLRSISWMQSHVIRAPLARLMGLIPMFVDPAATAKERKQIGNYVVASANEMDAVIKNIHDITSEVVTTEQAKG